MGPRDTLLAGLARQLGHPSGIAGRAVGRILNRRNRGTVTAAVAALELQPGETALAIGFGGGLVLDLLLRAAAGGTVHGVDVSDTVIAKARAAFPQNIAAGRLRLHRGSISALPLEDASMAAAITINTVYFVADLDGAFAEVTRVLAPGGRFVLGIGDPDAMAAAQVTDHDYHLRPVAEIETALGEAGLILRRHERVGESTRAAHLLVANR
ncbi:class I SAM-dependent methyltransferase [Amycolatopsis sp. FDAARGOS 1241]|uniref:class I SAM-dependent methyltransferase n=1 Tax=Amycolatopsis sp. FDAARGOS 1241 TaxID=2778070 RepID=UPI00194DD880|nr:class I SAM-dependent methyltransferase [Amycolatopsis sp. FDAARGOS 1241]QRP48144.1 methyltransferase domain-containing protein [Amycolatopsis sp. FDAARGOS 1241]